MTEPSPPREGQERACPHCGEDACVIFNRRVNGWETWVAYPALPGSRGAVEISDDAEKRYTDPRTGICDNCRKRRAFKPEDYR